MRVTPGSAAGQDNLIYQWTDSSGSTHYGDLPPDQAASIPIELPNNATGKAQGLRTGERALLRTIEQRQLKQRKHAQASHRKQRRLRSARTQLCQEKREQQRLGRHHGDGKAISKYLREHCW